MLSSIWGICFKLMNRHKSFVISNIDLYQVCSILLRRLSRTPATLFTILIFSVNSPFIVSAVVRLCSLSFKWSQIYNDFKKFNCKSKPENNGWYFEGSPSSIELKVGMVRVWKHFLLVLDSLFNTLNGNNYIYRSLFYVVRKYWVPTQCEVSTTCLYSVLY